MDEIDGLESPKVITLITPVDGVTEITLCEPTVNQLAKLNADTRKVDSIHAMKVMIATMAKIEVATVGNMRARDFEVCNKYLSGFFE